FGVEFGDDGFDGQWVGGIDEGGQDEAQCLLGGAMGVHSSSWWLANLALRAWAWVTRWSDVAMGWPLLALWTNRGIWVGDQESLRVEASRPAAMAAAGMSARRQLSIWAPMSLSSPVSMGVGDEALKVAAMR